MRHNKQEIRIYYETNSLPLKEVAKIFNVPYRTIAHWSKTEQWEQAKAIKHIHIKQKDIIQDEFNAVMQIGSEQIKQEIKHNLGTISNDIDAIVLDNILSESSQKLLLSAMSLNNIQRQATLSVLIAKDELTRILRNRTNKPDPMLIACAEKVAKLFMDLQNAIYGKDALKSTQSSNDDIKQMSNEELDKLLSEME